MIPTAAVEEMVVDLKRLINAPRERVFAAWTTPDEILKWFGPDDGCQLLSVRVDLRVGGEYCIRVNSKACGEATEVSGIYRQVERPSRLVYTWGWSDSRLDVGETLVTVDFVDVKGDTEVHLRHEGFPTTEHRDNHNYGWSASLEKLEKQFRNKQK
jgi:uncharacterized protein YndB with AHSA1/START domain